MKQYIESPSGTQTGFTREKTGINFRGFRDNSGTFSGAKSEIEGMCVHRIPIASNLDVTLNGEKR